MVQTDSSMPPLQGHFSMGNKYRPCQHADSEFFFPTSKIPLFFFLVPYVFFSLPFVTATVGIFQLNSESRVFWKSLPIHPQEWMTWSIMTECKTESLLTSLLYYCATTFNFLLYFYNFIPILFLTSLSLPVITLS